LSSEVTGYPLEIFSWQTGVALAMDDIRVRPFLTTHLKDFRRMTGNADIEAFLFEITAAGRRFVYSGDLGSPADLNEVLKEPVDLLICELAHFTPEELARSLRGARIGTLCLTHVSTDLDERRGEIQMLFERELSGVDTVYLPDDGERIEL
jgi:ribonuclease BN (tRNA processing enzyme)